MCISRYIDTCIDRSGCAEGYVQQISRDLQSSSRSQDRQSEIDKKNRNEQENRPLGVSRQKGSSKIR